MPDITECVPVSEAIKRTGLHPRTLDRRLQSGQFQVFRDPLDRRKRLLPLTELARLIDLQPIAYGNDRQKAS